MDLTKEKAKLFHFVGIAGIGMSSIAEAMAKWGFRIQGSNDVMDDNIESLRELGIQVWIGHEGAHVEGADYVVFSSAVPEDNAELAEARRRGIPLIGRASMLNNVMATKKSISISGTHGKTTTTSFVGTMLDVAGMDPTIIDGGIMNRYHSHNRIGEGDWIVAEACEAFGNLKHLTSDIVVVTNIDPEHMEFYHTFDTLENYFREFIARIPEGGAFIGCADHPAVAKLAREFRGKKNVLTYGTIEADITARGISTDLAGAHFDARLADGKIIDNLHIPLYGTHNVINSLAAIAVAQFFGIGDEHVRNALAQFVGTKHRFSRVGEARGATIFDDYAHHPQEIASTLAMAKSIAGKGRVLAIFQPHRYTRLSMLFDDFLKCFGDADHVIALPVYAAGEDGAGMKTHRDLANAMREAGLKNVHAIEDFAEAAPIISQSARAGDIIVSMGAGSIKKMIYDLPALLESAK
ncbi:MAG: UDP-N-acetylmuramate--L-alanine ligase [Rickettsiales bacterium]|jgi:UDP-N-acetylmuramate--alanine ligase|nr:UDP-N-acetylmuramate--L-alanine ligase [Rickettsiales bacterium]